MILNYAWFPMAMVHKYHIPPSEAWDMTMGEYVLLATIEKEQPVKPKYDKDEQERIIKTHELRELERG